MAADIEASHNLSNLTDGHYQILEKIDVVLLNKFHKIFYLLDNLKTSNEYKDLLSKDLQNLFMIYFNSAYNIINEKWDVDISSAQKGWTEGKMFILQKNFRQIFKDIISRNK